MKDYRNDINIILDSIGGEENVIVATHCVTRLRLVLKQADLVNVEQIEALDLVKGTFNANGQFQIVIGNGIVDEVYEQLISHTNISGTSKDNANQVAGEQQNIILRIVRLLSDIFIPILPVIVTSGLLLGINNLLVAPGIFDPTQSFVDMYPSFGDFASMINLIAGTAFVFLPVFIGWSAVKRLGGNELLGIALGLMMVHPDLLNAWSYGQAKVDGTIPYWDLWGLQVQMVGYQGQVLPVLASSFILVKIEKFMHRVSPKSISLLTVAPVTLLMTGFLTFMFIGPLTFAIGNLITGAIIYLFTLSPLLGGAIYGFIYAPMVITGMHQCFLAIDIQLIGTYGYTILWPILVLSNIAQGSAAFGIYFISKNIKEKELSFTGMLSAFMGITEPALFGINLRFKYPMIVGMSVTAVMGAYISIMQVKANSIGIGGVPGFLSIQPQYWPTFLFATLVCAIVPCILVVIIGKAKRK